MAREPTTTSVEGALALLAQAESERDAGNAASAEELFRRAIGEAERAGAGSVEDRARAALAGIPGRGTR